MQNPCSKCLVSVMCSNLCDEKKNYSEYWMKQLAGVCKHFYKPNGNKIDEKFIAKEIIKNKKRITERLDGNRNEINSIIFRPYGEFVK